MGTCCTHPPDPKSIELLRGNWVHRAHAQLPNETSPQAQKAAAGPQQLSSAVSRFSAVFQHLEGMTTDSILRFIWLMSRAVLHISSSIQSALGTTKQASTWIPERLQSRNQKKHPTCIFPLKTEQSSTHLQTSCRHRSQQIVLSPRHATTLHLNLTLYGNVRSRRNCKLACQRNVMGIALLHSLLRDRKESIREYKKARR